MITALKMGNSYSNISLSSNDYEKIQLLMQANPDIECSQLIRGLKAAKVVPTADMGKDRVTVNSKFIYSDSGMGEREYQAELILDNMTSQGRISVLSPLGAMMLGLKEGDEFTYKSATGRDRCVKIIKVLNS